MRIVCALVLSSILVVETLHATVHQIDLIGTAGSGLLPGNETPAVATGGTGGEIGAGITYNDDTNVLTLNVGWGSSQGFTDLSSASNNSHIHGPTTNNFGNSGGNFRATAGVVFTLTRSSNLATGGTVTNAPLSLSASQETDLLNGKWYINLHTSNNLGGEIRGFLVPVPTVTGISPSSGSSAGGTAVTITGTNFTGATAVTIGGVAATGVSVTDSTTITATTAARSAGTVNVVVTTPGGIATGTGLFTYSVPLSNNADLAALTISSGAMTPGFSSATTSYSTPSVPSSTSSVTVTPTAAQGNATIEARVGSGGFVSVASGGTSSALPIAVGSNTIQVKVTAQDTTTVKTYSVTVERQVPPLDYTITRNTTFGVNLIEITDNTGNGDVLTIDEPAAGQIRFSAPGRTFSINGASITTGDSGNISRTDIFNVVVNAGVGADTINVGSFTGLPSLTINGGTGDDTVNFTGDITFAANRNLDVDLQNDAATPGVDVVSVTSGSNVIASNEGTITVRASKSVSVTGGSSLETEHGAIIVEANQQSTPTIGNFIGVTVDGAGSKIRSTGSSFNVTVKGKGGNDSSGSQVGVSVTAGAEIKANAVGTLTVTGTGGDSTGPLNRGVLLSGTGSLISTNGAAITIDGTGGSNGSQGGTGVAVLLGGVINSNIGTLQVTGTGAGAVGSGSNTGIEVTQGSITSPSVTFGLTGTAGPGGPSGGSASWGLLIGTSGLVSTTNFTATLTLNANSASIDPTATISANLSDSSVVFNATNIIDLGGADAADRLGLTDAELDRVVTRLLRVNGTSHVISAPITRGGGFSNDFTIAGGTGLTASASGTDLHLSGSTLRLSQPLLMPITGAAPDTGFPQLKVNAGVDLTGSSLSINGTTHPGALGQTFTILDNQGSAVIAGTFSGLPEGATIPWPPNPNWAAEISYTGGTGNDVVLTIADPFQVTVTTTADSGAGSLRQAIANAATAPGVNTVTFDSSLAGDDINVLSEITINDPDGVIIDASALTTTCQIKAGLNNVRLIHHVAGSTAIIRGLWFNDGESIADGGAVLNEGSLTLDSCTFSDNVAVDGGAIQNLGTLTASQCTFSGNTSTGSGGAVNNEDHAVATFIHCTVSGNTSGMLGALANTGHHTITLANSIVYGNTGPLDVSGEIERMGSNICGNAPTTPAGTGPAYITADPLLLALQVNGTPLPTIPLGAFSPAIDQAGLLPDLPLVDQLGQPRVKGLRSDIGAVEGAVLIVTTAVDELDNPGSGYSLREAVSDAAPFDTIRFDRAVFTGGNTITLQLGPLNPQVDCTLNAADIPGGIRIVHNLIIDQHPQPQALAAGADASFGIIHANFNGGFAYSWRKDGSPISVFTQSLGITGVTEANEGLYDVLLTEDTSPGVLSTSDVLYEPLSVVSQPASLIVDGSPVAILRQPGNDWAFVGKPFALNVFATGPNLTFQWLKDGKKIAGATRATYTIPKAALSHAGAYTCVVKSGTTSVTSDSAEVAVADMTPKTINLKVGAKFTAIAAAKGQNLSFLWSSSQTTPSFTIQAVSLSDAGLYTCQVTGPAVLVGVSPIRLNVITAVPQLGTITLPPATIGQTYFYQLPVQNIAGAPATSFSVTGALPTGITLNKTTGILSGRPTTSKPTGYPLTFKAINLSGPSAPVTATLNVNTMPAGAIGTYAGPIERSRFNGDLGGRFDLTTTAAGTFSGSVTLGAIKRTFKNQLIRSSGPTDIILLGNIPAFNSSDNVPLVAYVEVFAAQQIARLTLVPPFGAPLLVDAWRKVPTANAATYTLRLDPNTVTDAPHGYGYSTLKATATNTVTITGKLPDNTALTGSTFVGPDGQILIYQLMHAKKGSLVGQYELFGTSVTGSLTWSKPLTKGTIYKDPFGPITVTAAGSQYTPPAAGQLAMPAASELKFTGGGLAPDFDQAVTIANPKPTGLTNTAKPDLPLFNTTKITKFDVKTGSITGSFMDGTRLAPWSGQLVKIGAITDGYGFFLLPTGVPSNTTSPKLSGKVVLGVP